MDVLILGGSYFIGRAVAERCIQRGLKVTVLNRGRRPVDDLRRFERLLAALDGAEPPAFATTADALVQLVHVEDLVAAIESAIDDPPTEPAARVFNIGGAALTAQDLVRRCAEQAGTHHRSAAYRGGAD